MAKLVSFSILLACLATVHIAIGNPMPRVGRRAASVCEGTQEIAAFDDIPSKLGVGPPPIEGVVPTPYKDLAWPDFDFRTPLANIAGVTPASGNIFAFTNRQNAQITTDYPDSTVSFFTLKSFRYACSNAVAEAAACTVTLTGFRGDPVSGEATLFCAKKFNYLPDSGNGPQPMGVANDPSIATCFEDVDFIEVTYAPTAAGGLSLDLDSVAFTPYRCS